jgi:hypothetical protein
MKKKLREFIISDNRTKSYLSRRVVKMDKKNKLLNEIQKEENL